MNIKILIDMNLSPEWIDIFEAQGWAATHWSMIGHPTDDDSVIIKWASTHGHIVFTHDLDFSAILATSRLVTPSVIQLRSQDILPDQFAEKVVLAVKQFEQLLQQGALIVVDLKKSRARILPLIASQN